ncbi:hypothetical protein GCM10007415_39760 [Parapedobacter pyrenivorans]|uniref:HEAT repeat domain-containing protein n=2 Tax=Parapedobacter pyrenivorans TaxID=1305674 RepID=A0A917MDT4_9SPHI|nr:hypothetical protein GCM10007415_39760 [Parapedobacter pyrenivorans]
MKNFWMPVIALVVGLTSPVSGQTPLPADAVVNNVLALLPAEDGTAQHRLMATLAEGGRPAVTALAILLAAPDSATRVRASYALSGLAAYATTRTEADRAKIASAYAHVLTGTDQVAAKLFMIRQLQWMAGDEATAALVACLNDPALAGPAAHALANIGTADALRALMAAVPNQSDPGAKEQLILALAQAKASDAETLILGLVGTGEENQQRAVFYALGELGTAVSLPALAAAAKAAGYTYDRLGATAAYLTLINRVATLGHVERAGKEARKLMNRARKKQAHQTRIAALQLVMVTDPSHAAAVAAKAQQDADARFRAAAWRFAEQYGHGVELATQLNKTR